LGAVVFPDTTLALTGIAVGWAILFPLLVIVAKRNNGYPTDTDAVTNNGSYANV